MHIMSNRIFHVLVTWNEAKDIIRDEIRKIVVEGEEVDVKDANNRITAEDIISLHDVPPFDRAEVDGYAVYHEDIEGADDDNPIRLNLIGEVRPGQKLEIELRRNSAIRISTGSMMPRGADSVIMVEYTKHDNNHVIVYRGTVPGENIQYAGSDFYIGELLVPKNSLINPEKIALLSAAGIGKIKVYKKLKIGIFSTGDELKRPGEELRDAQIYDANSYYFYSTLNSLPSVEAYYIGIVKDNYDEMKKLLLENLDRFDILISSGSTSSGYYDILYRVVEDLGGNIIFHGIKIKPGKPTFFAKIRNKLLIGMPGFPMSSAIVLKFIVEPAILEAFNTPVKLERKPLAVRVNMERGRDQLIPAIVTKNGKIYPLYGQPGSISRLSYADGIILLHGNITYYEKDELVEFLPFNAHLRDSIIAIGSVDPLLERAIYSIDTFSKIINKGFGEVIEAVKNEISDISGISLICLDNNNQLLTTLLNDKELMSKAYLIRGYFRTIGFVSKRDVISSFKEIVEKKLLFVNRDKNSAARVLIDYLIDTEDPHLRSKIRGYSWEVTTYAAVARAIAQDRADVGISLEYYARKLGLNFRPLKDEEYDILINKKFYGSELGKKFIEALKNLGQYVESYPGYKIPNDIGEIISS